MNIRNMLQQIKSRALTATEPALEGEIVLPNDTHQPMKIGLWVLGIGFGGFVLWAALAPLDEGVPTQGMVTIDTKRKAVQHLAGGIIKEVFIKEGQFVKNGEPLIRLDDATTLATFEAVKQHYLTLRAMEGRLQAEQLGQDKIIFHEDLSQATGEAIYKQILFNQEQLFQSRRQALRAEMQAIRETILGMEASIQGYEGMLSSRKNQQQLLQEEIKGMRELVGEGYAPRNKLLELERMLAESFGSISELQGNIQRNRNGIAELKMRANQRSQEYAKEVASQLADVRREVQADADKLKAASNDLDRTLIRSPADGQVVGLATQTVGGVIGPGQKIMDVVPKNETLLLEAKVMPHLIDRVRVGSPTDVRFAAFAHSPQLVVEGKIESISSDLIVEQQTNMSYYLARVSITSEGMKDLGNHQLQAGMPAEVMIKTGQRSMLTYLLHPLLKRMAASMKEE